MSDWQKIFEAIDIATEFSKGCEPFKASELKRARRCFEKIAADTSEADEAKTDHLIGLLLESADQMEACDFHFMAADLREAVVIIRKLGYPQSGPHLVR